MEDSIAMLEMAAGDGISHIFATPHYRPGLYGNSKEGVIRGLGELTRRIRGDMSLYYGADVRVSHDIIERVESGQAATLNGSRYLLLELTDYALPPNLEDLVFRMRGRGLIPVITHPERHSYFFKNFDVLRDLRKRGAMFQVTAMSLTGGFGKTARKVSKAMLESSLLDFVASDAHNLDGRPPVLSRAFEEIRKEFGIRAAETIFFRNPLRILEAAARR
jgi:protein-tyrosine phosphatase